jgi:DNA primase
VGLQVNDLAAALRTHGRAPVRIAPTRQIGSAENAEFVAVAMLMQRWDDIAPWLVEDLFAQDVARRAFLAVAESGGGIEKALELADPEARELLERAAVADVDADPVMEARNLISATTRRLLARQVGVTETEALRAMREARLALERIDQPEHADDAAEALLGWIHGANEENG